MATSSDAGDLTAGRHGRRRRLAGGIAALVVVLVGVGTYALTRPDDTGDGLRVTGPDPADSSSTTEPTPLTLPLGTDLATGTWTALAASPLSKRTRPITAWTGTEMLVWGGEGFTTDVCTLVEGGAMRCGDQARHDGAAYDPATDTWRMLPPAPLPEDQGSWPTYRGAFVGGELVVWGGPEASGAAYDPETDRWRTIADSPLGPRNRFTVARMGDDTPEVVVVGGRSEPEADSSGDQMGSMPLEVAA